MTDTPSHTNPDANAEREQLLERISAWIAGELPQADAAELQARIAVDAELAAEYEAMRRSWELFDALASPVSVSAALEARVLQEVEAMRSSAAEPISAPASTPAQTPASPAPVLRAVAAAGDAPGGETSTIAPVSASNPFAIPRWVSASAAACLIAVVAIYLIVVMQPGKQAGPATAGLASGTAAVPAIGGWGTPDVGAAGLVTAGPRDGLRASVVGRASLRTHDGQWRNLSDGDTLDAVVAGAPGAGHVIAVGDGAQVTLAGKAGSITIGSGAVVALTADPTRMPREVATTSSRNGLAPPPSVGLCVEVHRVGRLYVDLQADPDADAISFRTPAAFADIAPGSSADLAIGLHGAVTVSLATGTADVAGLDPVSGAVITRGRMSGGHEVDINAYGNAASRKLLNVDWVGAWTRALAPRIDDRWEKRRVGDASASPRDGAVGQLIATDPEYDLVPFRCEFADVVVDIADGYARTTLSQTFVNDAERTLDGLFTLPLPEGATLTGATLTLSDGTTLIGRFVERNRARAVFEQERAKARRDPVLLEWLAGSTFQATVASIGPGERKRLSVSWLSPVPAVLDASTGTLVREYQLPLVRKPHLTLEHMSLRLRADAALAMTLDSDTHNVEVAPSDDGRAIEAKMLARDYRPSRDLVVRLRQPIALHGGLGNSSGEGPAPRDGALVSTSIQRVAGGFAVARTYKQTRSDRGYVTLTFTPILDDELEAHRRGLEVEPEAGNVLVAVDTSGSTAGDVALYQQAMLAALGTTLRRDDRLNVLAFDSEATWLRNGPVPVTRPNLDGFHTGLQQRRRVGATDLERALHAIVDAIIHEAQSAQPPGSNNGAPDPSLVRPTTVYLLTDGRPTLGARNGLVLAAIADRLEAANLKGAVRLFAVAVSDRGNGGAPNTAALRDVAQAFGGALVHVNALDAELAALRLRDVRQRVALTNLTIATTGALIEAVSPPMHVIAPGQPLMVAAAFDPTGGDASVIIRANIGRRVYEGRVDLSLPASASETDGDATIRKIWAVQRIAQFYRDHELLELEAAQAVSTGAEPAPQAALRQARLAMLRAAIVACSTHAGVASPFTSLLIVNPEALDEHGLKRDVEALQALRDAIDHAHKAKLPLVRVDQRLYVDGADVPPPLAIRAAGTTEWVDFNQLDGAELPLTAEVRLARGAIARLLIGDGDAVLQGGYVVRLGDMLDVRDRISDADLVALGLSVEPDAAGGGDVALRTVFSSANQLASVSALFMARTDELNDRVADVQRAHVAAERKRLADDRDAARASLTRLGATLDGLTAQDVALQARVNELLTAIESLIQADDVDPIASRDALATWLELASFYGDEWGFDTVASFALRRPLTRSEYEQFVVGDVADEPVAALTKRRGASASEQLQLNETRDETRDGTREAQRQRGAQLDAARLFVDGQTARPGQAAAVRNNPLAQRSGGLQSAWQVERARRVTGEQQGPHFLGGAMAPGDAQPGSDLESDRDEGEHLADPPTPANPRPDNSEGDPRNEFFRTDREGAETSDPDRDDGTGANSDGTDQPEGGAGTGDANANNNGTGAGSGGSAGGSQPRRDPASDGRRDQADKDDDTTGADANDGNNRRAESANRGPLLDDENVWSDTDRARSNSDARETPGEGEPNEAPGDDPEAPTQPTPPSVTAAPRDALPRYSRRTFGRQDLEEIWDKEAEEAEKLHSALSRSAVRDELEALQSALQALAERKQDQNQLDDELRGVDGESPMGARLLDQLRHEQLARQAELDPKSADPLDAETTGKARAAAGPIVRMAARGALYSELLDTYHANLRRLLAHLTVEPLQRLRVRRAPAAEAGDPDAMARAVAPVLADRVVADMALGGMPPSGTSVFTIELSRAMADPVPASVLSVQPYAAAALVDVRSLYDLARLQVVDAIAHLAEGEAFSVVVFAREPLVLMLTNSGEVALAPMPAPGRRAEPGVRLAATSATLRAIDALLAEMEPDGECDLDAAVKACFTSTLFDHALNAVRGKTVYLLSRGFVSWSDDSTAYVAGTGRGNGAGVARPIADVEAALIARNEAWGLRIHTVGLGAHDARRLSAIARATGGEHVDTTGGRNTGLPPALETPAARVARLAQRFAQRGESAEAWLWLTIFSQRHATPAATADAFDAWLRAAEWLGNRETVIAAAAYVNWLTSANQRDQAARVVSQLLEIGGSDIDTLRACEALARQISGDHAARIMRAAQARLAQAARR